MQLSQYEPLRILIIRTSAIGDIVFASAFVHALRQTYPDSHIAWLIQVENQSLLANSADIDELIVLPTANWQKLWNSGQKWKAVNEVLAFGKKLKQMRFDMAIDLQGLLKSGLFAWFSQAKKRIGLGSREGSQFLMSLKYPRGGKTELIGSEYIYLAEQLNLKLDSYHPVLNYDSQAKEQAMQKLDEQNLKPGQYIVFAAFTTRPQKHWINTHWKTLAAMVKNQLHLDPLLLGGPSDLPAASEILAVTPELKSLAGKTTLAEAMAIIDHAAAVAGVDTGLTHMGIAFNTPTIAIFGSTCPYRETTRQNARVIWLGLSCSPCRRNPSCQGRFTCLDNITPQLVMDNLKQVMQRHENTAH